MPRDFVTEAGFEPRARAAIDRSRARAAIDRSRARAAIDRHRAGAAIDRHRARARGTSAETASEGAPAVVFAETASEGLPGTAIAVSRWPDLSRCGTASGL